MNTVSLLNEYGSLSSGHSFTPAPYVSVREGGGGDGYFTVYQCSFKTSLNLPFIYLLQYTSWFSVLCKSNTFSFYIHLHTFIKLCYDNYFEVVFIGCGGICSVEKRRKPMNGDMHVCERVSLSWSSLWAW